MNSSSIIRVCISVLLTAVLSMPAVLAAPGLTVLPSDQYQELKYRNDRGETLKFRGIQHFQIKWILEMESATDIVMNAAKNRIYLTEDNAVIAYDLSGIEQWRYPLPDNGFNYYLLQIGADGTIYAVHQPSSYSSIDNPGRVIALNGQGKRLWEYRLDNLKSVSWMTYGGNAKGTFVTISDDGVTGIRNGKIVWKKSGILQIITNKYGDFEFTTTNIKRIFTDRKGTAYIQTDRKLFALNDSGKVIWSRDFKEETSTLVLIQKDNYILSTSINQWFLIDSVTGKNVPGNPVNSLWLKETEAPNDGHGGLYVSNYYFRSNSGNGISKVDSNGNVLWEYDMRFPGYADAWEIVSDPAGNVVFTDSGGTLYSLDRKGNERFMLVYRNKTGPDATKSVIDKDGNVYALVSDIGLMKIMAKR